MNDKFLFTGQIPGMGNFGFGYVDDDSISNDPRFANYTQEEKKQIKAKMKEIAERLMANPMKVSMQMVIQAEQEVESFARALKAPDNLTLKS